MRLLLASSEVHPYSKTGGLADMVSALAKTLARMGHTVGLVTPLYLGIRERFPELRRLELPLDVPLGSERVQGEVWTLEPTVGLTIYFVDQPAYFQRSALYAMHGMDYPDNAERFIFFSKAVAHLALHLPWKPELVHVQDWQVGLVPLLLAHQRRLSAWSDAPRSCMTIHNLAYQGVFSASRYALTNLPWDYFNPEAVEFYGQLNCLKAGIAMADVITTVSPRYAREITTEAFGCGLEGLLQRRQDSICGILNGVDYEEWKTIGNPFLKHEYDLADFTGKLANKLDLQREFGLPADPAIPLFGNIGRMVEQKGVDIMLAALEELVEANLQFVMLGSGSPAFEAVYQGLARRLPAKVGVRVGFNEALSHRIEAGCDFFLMPSRFEPCGLNQMYSLRYGTIPIVRQTGGLDDTVIDPREAPERANGIKFTDYAGYALAKAMHKALALYQEPQLLQLFRANAITADFSWDRTAAEYVSVYQRAAGQGALLL